MSKLSIRPLSPTIGAEIHGLDTNAPLDADTVRQLRAAFDEHSVLVFRKLDIDTDTQRDIVFSLIGEEVTPEKIFEPQTVSNKTENASAPYGRLLFHCDAMWSNTPQRVVSLYGQHVEPPGAPTQFMSMGHAWDTLPQKLRARVERLEARHGYDEVYPNRGGDADVIDSHMEGSRFTTRPVVWAHPRTGRPLLYISQQSTIDIVGLSAEENEELLQELFDHLYRPEVILTHEWAQGDLVAWDNIGAQHGRNMVTLAGPARTLRKVIGPLSYAQQGFSVPTFSKIEAQKAAM